MKYRHWIAALIVLLALLGALAWHYWPRTVPPEECSAAYREYSQSEHIAASFLKDFRVNDTVSVDVTLLEAKDEVGWEALRKRFLSPKDMSVYSREEKKVYIFHIDEEAKADAIISKEIGDITQ